FLESTKIKLIEINISDVPNSHEAGKNLANKLLAEDLAHILVISEGISVNGNKLVEGFNAVIPKHIAVTGGLAGDGADFKKTVVGLNKTPKEGNLVAVGFYGKKIKVGFSSMGGWDPFGPTRIITKSKDNVLYEIDNKSALDLYKTYLGDTHSKGLPGTGLLFPLSIQEKDDIPPIVRTLLGVNESEHSMTFAGDMPEGSMVRLMKANYDRLIEGACEAAENSRQLMDNVPPQLAILVSCVGRKLILNKRIEEEVEGVQDVIGSDTTITGFYSYGEIAPLSRKHNCQLHNQTMTITLLSEIE
ncbi:MAG: FIST C-terminal domain-containing protein, partial [Cytophagaceae bacterium]|nr:FIST C-terminal domain-containing protein [Cytophagaceae bacterium]